jgi:hypothetical protein
MKLFSFLVLAGLCGCVNNATKQLSPAADLSKIKTICVEKFAPDGRELNLLIVDALNRFNYNASTADKCPDNVDAVLTYRDKWMWDMSMYMVSISIKLSDPSTGFPLAFGQALHTSLTRQTPKETINEVLSSMFSKP